MSKTNPKVHALQPAPKQPTEEEIRAQALRAMAQQHRAMAQTFAANICHGTPFQLLTEYGALDIADFADELATAFMDKWYKPKEEDKTAE